jgi:hypothetical protein
LSREKTLSPFSRQENLNNFLPNKTTQHRMAQILSTPQNCNPQKLPEHDRIQLALQWLHENLTETAAVAAKIYHVKDNTIRTARRQEKKRGGHMKLEG